METPLFRPKPTISFEKVANTTRLEDDPDDWPAEIIKEAYRQLPWLKGFETDVEIEKVEPSRGYAVGRMLVYPAQLQKEAAATDKRLLTIPIIVRDRELSPLDVYMHEKVSYPMDEDKVQRVMFDPSAFMGPADPSRFGSTALHTQTRPPASDQRYATGSLHKQSSVRPSLLKVAAPTFRTQDVEAFAERLRTDHPLRHAYATREVQQEAALEIVNSKEKTASDRKAYRRSHVRPTVVQFRKHGNAFMVKSANHHCFRPSENIITRFDAQKALSKEAFDVLQNDGVITMTVDPVVKDQAVEKTASEAGAFGVYNVWLGGQEVQGIVVPKVISFDETPLDAALFSSPKGHAFQEKVAGVYEGPVELPESTPSGMGVFVYQSGNRAVATEPVRIKHRVTMGEGSEKVASFLGKRLSDGSDIRLTVVHGLQKMASIGNYEIAIPSDFRWLPLMEKQIAVPAQAGEAQDLEVTKTASVNTIEVLSDGSFFAVRGSNASAFTDEAMDQADAEFALAALGLSGRQIRETCKTAAAKGKVKVAMSRPVVTEDDYKANTMIKMASVVKSLPDLRVDLVKEASVIHDKETVDAILSLGFINPENMALYVDYLPDLEKVASKLAEILVASRLGMDDVREAAAKNAMTQMNSVIRGLSGLQARIQ